MQEFYVSTPRFTCWVQVDDGHIVSTAPYLKRERGKKWSGFIDNIYRQPGGRIVALDTVVVGYQEHEIFLLPWETIQPAGRPSYVTLKLPKVSLEFRIIWDEQTVVYAIWCRHAEEQPWKLGQHRSVEECKFKILDHIVYFKLYKTGTWDHNPQRLR